MVSALVAYRVRSTFLGCAVLSLLGWLSRSELVSLPLLQERLPARALVGVVTAAVVLTPLYAVAGDLAHTLVRERALRPVRAVGALVATAVAVVPAYSGEVMGAPWVVVDVRILLALLALGLVSVVVLGDAAGLVVLGVGFLVLLVTATPGSWLAGATLATPTFAFVSAIAAGAVAYVVRGPRSRRADEER